MIRSYRLPSSSARGSSIAIRSSRARAPAVDPGIARAGRNARLAQRAADRVGVDPLVAAERGDAPHEILEFGGHCPASRSTSSTATASAIELLRGGRPVLGGAIEEVAREQRHVLAAFAQRRQAHRHDVEPVERDPRGTARPGRAGPDPCWSRRRCATSARIVRAPAHRGELARLEHAQQPRLRAPSACRRSRRGTGCRPPPARTCPAPRVAAPVKAPRSCPNSSASISSRGIAAMLSATNGARPARAEIVDRLRDQLLAGARFARDQHGQVVRARRARSRDRLPASPASGRSAAMSAADLGARAASAGWRAAARSRPRTARPARRGRTAWADSRTRRPRSRARRSPACSAPRRRSPAARDARPASPATTSSPLPSGSTTSVTSTSGTPVRQRAAQLGDARGGGDAMPSR